MLLTSIRIGGAISNLTLCVDSLDKFYKWIDGYDQGIHYADTYIGKVLKILEESRVLDDTAIIVTADHAENIGELNIYGDHHTADYCTSRIPFILKWPGLKSEKVDSSLHYQVDFAATILEMLGVKIPERWDGKSFAPSLSKGKPEGREYLVISNCAWSCQRSVRYRDWLMMRTYHESLHDWPERMLYDLKEDPHETNDLTEKNPEMVGKCLEMLDKWHKEMMDSSDNKIDPMQTVIKEGGSYHTRDMAQIYAQRLKETGREKHAQKILNWLKEGRYRK